MMTLLPNKPYSGHLEAKTKTVTREHMQKRSAARNGDSSIQVQLEENGGGGSI